MANPFGLSNVGSRSAPVLIDIDRDGDLDLFVGTSDGNTRFFPNEGTDQAPSFGLPITNPFELSDVGAFSSPAFGDLLGSAVKRDVLFGNGLGDLVFFDNITGSGGGSLAFAPGVTNPFGLANAGAFSAPLFLDIDGDGDLDVLVGNEAGDLVLFNNTGSVTGPVFAGLLPAGGSDVTATGPSGGTILFPQESGPTVAPTATPTGTPTATSTSTPAQTPNGGGPGPGAATATPTPALPLGTWPAPTLGARATVVAVLLLMLVAFWGMRQIGLSRTAALLVAGLVGAATGSLTRAAPGGPKTMDGDVADWTGVPQIAGDPLGDSSKSDSGEDLLAAFLDRETAKIDGLVARKERLIELLQEKRTALITRAVTRGLDPNVPMKDSGVEWLGEIPAHLGGEKALAPHSERPTDHVRDRPSGSGRG